MVRSTLATTVLIAALSCSPSSPSPAPPAADWPNTRPSLPSEAELFVASHQTDTLIAVDPSSLTKTAGPFPVGDNPLEIDGPTHIGRDFEGHYFVLLDRPFRKEDVGPHQGHGTLDGVGVIQRLSPDTLAIEGRARVDESPGMLAVSPTGREVIVSHFDKTKAADTTRPEIDQRADLIVFQAGPIDPDTLGRRVRACRAPNGFAFGGPARRRVFVACWADDSVADFDLDDPTLLVRRTPLAQGGDAGASIGPYAAGATLDGSLVAIGGDLAFEVIGFDTSRLEIAWRLPTSGPVRAIAWSANDTAAVLTLAPPTIETFTRSGASLRRQTMPSECLEATSMIWGPNDSTLLVACATETDGRLFALSADTLAVTASSSTSPRPLGLLRTGP